MSDSSDAEDLSHLQGVVDTSFIDQLRKKDNLDIKNPSLRYLKVESHYNDVQVSDELQQKIAKKLSKVIDRNIKFVDVKTGTSCESTIKGGVKLFKDSPGFLSCDEPEDTLTAEHNKHSKHLRKKTKKSNLDNDIYSESEKVKLAVIQPDFIISKEETRLWKSRRKEKLQKYKLKKPENILIPIEN